MSQLLGALGTPRASDAAEDVVAAFLRLQGARAAAAAAAAKAAAAAEADARAAKLAVKGGAGSVAAGKAAVAAAAAAPAPGVTMTALGGAADLEVALEGAAAALATLLSDPGLCASAVGHFARVKNIAAAEVLAIASASETGVFVPVDAVKLPVPLSASG